MKSTQGFTLIELLIVIAIIGILAAVLIPNLLNARKSANDSATQSYLRNAITAAEAYRSQNPTAILSAATPCTSANVTGGTLPGSTTACQVQQTANGTYGFATSSTGKHYQFDGSTIAVAAAAGMPASMP